MPGAEIALNLKSGAVAFSKRFAHGLLGHLHVLCTVQSIRGAQRCTHPMSIDIRYGTAYYSNILPTSRPGEPLSSHRMKLHRDDWQMLYGVPSVRVQTRHPSKPDQIYSELDFAQRLTNGDEATGEIATAGYCESFLGFSGGTGSRYQCSKTDRLDVITINHCEPQGW